jgi:hypothetical protein
MWPHGYSYFQQPDWKGFQYVLKYVLKDQDSDSAATHLAMSKKPPLGAAYFEQLAQQYVKQGLQPRSFKYKICGVRKDNGQEKQFMMQGKTRDNFMTAFKEGWKEKYGKEPTNEFFEQWDEKNYTVTYTDEELIKRLHSNPVKYVEPWKTYMSEDQSEWLEINYQGIDLVLWEHDHEVWIYIEDGQEWHENRSDVISRLKTTGKIKKRSRYVDVLRDQLSDQDSQSEELSSEFRAMMEEFR